MSGLSRYFLSRCPHGRIPLFGPLSSPLVAPATLSSHFSRAQAKPSFGKQGRANHNFTATSSFGNYFNPEVKLHLSPFPPSRKVFQNCISISRFADSLNHPVATLPFFPLDFTSFSPIFLRIESLSVCPSRSFHPFPHLIFCIVHQNTITFHD